MSVFEGLGKLLFTQRLTETAIARALVAKGLTDAQGRTTIGSAASVAAGLRAIGLTVVADTSVVAPAAPTLGTPTVASGQISIPFTDGSNGGAAITSHNVYRGTASGAETLLGNLTTGSPFIDTGLTNGSQYFYKMSAVNSIGESALSSEVGASPAPATRLQNVGSAMRGPGLETGNQSNGTDTAFNSETWHYNEAGATVPGIAPVTGTWRNDTDGNGTEVPMTGPVTWTGSIEYPVGTRTPLTWSGATSVVQAPGTNLVTDMPSVPGGIPDGAMYGIHLFGTVAAGVKWPLAQMVGTGVFQTGGKVDRYESGAAGTLTDKTASGSPANIGGVGGYGCRPIGAVASVPTSSAKLSIVGIGDSIAAGATEPGFDGRNNRSWAGRAAGKRHVAYSHFAITGSTAQASAASGKMAFRLDALKKLNPTDVWLMYGTNDLNGGRTLAQVQADLLTLANAIANAIPGVRIATNTILPRHAVAGADGGETIARQVIPTSGAFIAGSGSVRAQYNAWVRMIPAPFSYMIEVADALDVNASNVLTRDGGYWATGEPGGRSYLDTTYTGQVTGSPTTTSVPTNIVKASTASYFAYYSNGYAVFADGTLRLIGNNTGGTLTFGTGGASTALPSAPAVGDAVTIQGNRMRATGDMTHPGGSDNTTGAEFGGIYVLRDVGAAKIQSIGG